MEELIIRRRCGNAISNLFKPAYVEEIRVRKRQDSSRESIAHRRPSRSPDHVTKARVHREEFTRGWTNEPDRYDSRGIRMRIRSTSRSRYEDSDRDEPAAPARERSVDYRIACHPRAWSHGHMETVLRPVARKVSEPLKPRRPQSPQRPSSPPEWYYRHVRRVMVPGRQRRGEGSDDEPTRKSEDSDVTRAPPSKGLPEARGRKALPPPERRRHSPVDKHNPIRGVLQHARHDRIGRQHDLYGAEHEHYRRRHPQGSVSSEEGVRERHVRFAPPAKPKGSRAQNRQDERLHDWEQARRDEHEIDDVKKRVRKGVHKAGGNYELYEVDGHYSEEYEPPGKHRQSGRDAQKSLYNKRDERSEGALSWFELFGGMES